MLSIDIPIKEFQALIAGMCIDSVVKFTIEHFKITNYTYDYIMEKWIESMKRYYFGAD